MEIKPAKIYEIAFGIFSFFALLCALFDATYLVRIPYTGITLRDLYLESYPVITALYDPVKGIEEHRFTISYQKDWEEFRSLLSDPTVIIPAQEPQGSEPESAIRAYHLMVSLRDRSLEMIDKPPGYSYFHHARKEGSFEKVKNVMRRRYKTESSREAFKRFYSAGNLIPARRFTEFAFYDKELKPLLKHNYFRWIGEDGEYTDYYYRFDRWIVLIFGIDFLFRFASSIIHQKYKKWYIFAIRQWYEIFNLVVPHHEAVIRLLRVIPFYMRLKVNRFLPDDGILPDMISDHAEIIAREISGLVLVNILGQIRTIVSQTDIKELRGKIDTDAIMEARGLIDHQLDIVSEEILPKLHPEITALIHHSLNKAMEPYLVSPVGIFARILLLNIQVGVRDALDAALSSDEGKKEVKAIASKVLDLTFEKMLAEENMLRFQTGASGLLKKLEEKLREDIQKHKI